MTQQDDITQRLRDNAELDEAEHGNARVVQLEREAADEIERLRAELSKLRAPVADERAAHDNWYSRTHMHEYSRDATWRGWQERARRAALASAPDTSEADASPIVPGGPYSDPEQFIATLGEGAPVAGEAQPVAWRYRRASQKESMRLAGRDPSEAEWHFAPHAARATEMREGLRYNFAPSSDHVDWEPLYAAPQASAEPVQEVAGVTLDGCLETLFRVGEHLGINYAESRKQPGAPSGVYIKAIEDRISQASNAAREEAAKLMDQTSRSSGAELIRALKTQADKDGSQQRAGDDDLLRFAWKAIRAELDPQWECNSYHPMLYAAEERLRAALSAPQAEQGERDA